MKSSAVGVTGESTAMTKSEVRDVLYDILEEREGDLDDQLEGVLDYLLEENLIDDDEEEEYEADEDREY